MKQPQPLQSSIKKKFIQINGRRTSNKRKTIDEPEKFQHITDKIDHILKNDYAMWRHQQVNFDVIKCETAHNTSLLKKYIKCIYSQYKIPDPLDQKNQTNNNSWQIQSDRKILNLFQVKELNRNQFHTPQKDKPILSNIKFSINSAQAIKPELKLQNSRANTSYTARESGGYNLNQSINRPMESINNNTIRRSEHQNQNIITHRIMESRMTHLSHQQFIKQSYRYCVGCQSAILQHNIESHQTKCIKFNDVFNKNPQQILMILDNKILQISQKCGNNKYKLQKGQIQQMLGLSQSMSIESRKCISLGKQSKRDEQFMKDYNRSMYIGKKWCQSIEQIAKLNWFMQIREFLSKQMHKKQFY